MEIEGAKDPSHHKLRPLDFLLCDNDKPPTSFSHRSPGIPDEYQVFLINRIIIF